MHVNRTLNKGVGVHAVLLGLKKNLYVELLFGTS